MDSFKLLPPLTQQPGSQTLSESSLSPDLPTTACCLAVSAAAMAKLSFDLVSSSHPKITLLNNRTTTKTLSVHESRWSEHTTGHRLLVTDSDIEFCFFEEVFLLKRKKRRNCFILKEPISLAG